MPELPTFHVPPGVTSSPSNDDINDVINNHNHNHNPHFFDLKDGRRMSIRSSFLGPMMSTNWYNYNYNNAAGGDTSSIDKLSSMSISSISGGNNNIINNTNNPTGSSGGAADRSSGSSGRSSGLTSHSSMSSGRISLRSARRKHSLHLPGFDARLSSTMGLSHSISNSVRLSIGGGGGGGGGGADRGGGGASGQGGESGQVERDSLISIVSGLGPAGIDTSTPNTTTAATATAATTTMNPTIPMNDELSPRASEMSHESFLLLGAYAKDLQEDRDSRIINPRKSSNSELMEALDYYFDGCGDDDDDEDDNEHDNDDVVAAAVNADTIANDEEVKHEEEVKRDEDHVEEVKSGEERELDMKLLSIQEQSSALHLALETPTKESPVAERRTLTSKKHGLSPSTYNTKPNKRNRHGSLADECILSMIVDSVVTDVVEQVVTPDVKAVKSGDNDGGEENNNDDDDDDEKGNVASGVVPV